MPRISSHPHALTSRRRQHHTTITRTGLPKSAAPNSIMPVKCSFCRKDTSVQAHMRHTCAVPMQISISYSHPPYGIHLRMSLPTGEPTSLTPMNQSNTPIQTTNQILPEIQAVVSATPLMIRLGGNLKQKYSRTTRTQSLWNRRIIWAPGKPFERLKSIRKNAGICVRSHGLLLLLHKVSNLHLGSLRTKSQRRGLMIPFRMVSETRHPSAIAL